MDRRLTDRQRIVLDYLRDYTAANGVPPSMAEIGRACGGVSATAALAHIVALERKGYIRRDPHRARGVELIAQPGTEERPSFYRLPIVGVIAAGQPIEAYEESAEHIWVEASLARHSDNFVLRVSGQSMIGDGIYDGDYVIVHPQDFANNGETVVALIGGNGATLKRYYRERGRVRLQPANPYMEAMFVTDVVIQGKVVAVIRRYE